MCTQSSCCADLPSLCARSRLHAGRRERWQDLAWGRGCDLAGFGSANGTQEAGGGSGAGHGLGVPAVGVVLRIDHSLQNSFVSTWTGTGFTFLPRVLEMLTFKREVSLVDLCQWFWVLNYSCMKNDLGAVYSHVWIMTTWEHRLQQFWTETAAVYMLALGTLWNVFKCWFMLMHWFQSVSFCPFWICST